MTETKVEKKPAPIKHAEDNAEPTLLDTSEVEYIDIDGKKGTYDHRFVALDDEGKDITSEFKVEWLPAGEKDGKVVMQKSIVPPKGWCGMRKTTALDKKKAADDLERWKLEHPVEAAELEKAAPAPIG